MMELNSKIKQLYTLSIDTAWYSTKIKDLSEELGLFQFDFSEDGPEY